MPYVWAKLLLGLVTVAISAILFGILVWLPILLNREAIGGIMFILWIILTCIIRFIIIHYIGYMFKAGHIAVITEAVVTGSVPDHQLAYGKQRVVERFGTANVYFIIDKLVSGAVKQIQRGIGRLGNALKFVPGMGIITSLAQMFVEMSLGYVDECCLGFTFLKREQSAFRSAADGVVIYAQNWKKLLGNAAKTMVLVIIGFAVITLALFMAIMLVFRLFNWPGWAAFIIALLISLTIKSAFVDSFILTRTMVAYIGVAPTTVITFDLYGKLSGLSRKFKKLWEQGQQEDPTPQPAYAGAYPVDMQQPYPNTGYGYQEEKPVFCGQCGTQNVHKVNFCRNCGCQMQ